MKPIVFNILFSYLLFLAFPRYIYSQNNRINTIYTAVPFLYITPDARHGALGGSGGATSPDVNDNFYNSAKLTFMEEEGAFGLSYTPWLSQLLPGINLSYLTAMKKIDNQSAIGMSFRYFSLGSVQFTDQSGNPTIAHDPSEFAVDLAYSRQLSDRFSMAIAFRFIYSNLTGGQSSNGAASRPGIAGAADVMWYYQNKDINMGSKNAVLRFGGGITNVGNKMTYSNVSEEAFLPMNFKVGGGLTLNLDEYNDISFTIDVNKLLVPTPPIYDQTTNEIIAGSDPNVSVPTAIFSSWSDAPGEPVKDNTGAYVYNDDGSVQVVPGSVFKEELRELNYNIGLEYVYNNVFSTRLGLLIDDVSKGNRQYFSMGLGLKQNVFAFDFSYLVPATSSKQNIAGTPPLANTLQFSMSFNIGGNSTGKSSNRGQSSF